MLSVVFMSDTVLGVLLQAWHLQLFVILFSSFSPELVFCCDAATRVNHTLLSDTAVLLLRQAVHLWSSFVVWEGCCPFRGSFLPSCSSRMGISCTRGDEDPVFFFGLHAGFLAHEDSPEILFFWAAPWISTGVFTAQDFLLVSVAMFVLVAT